MAREQEGAQVIHTAQKQTEGGEIEGLLEECADALGVAGELRGVGCGF